MEKPKIMPRHLLLLFFPLATAIVGGLIFSGDFATFTQTTGGRGISQAQLYVGISLLTGLLAFGHKSLPKEYNWGIIILSPLLLALPALPQFGGKMSLALLFLLNLAFTLGLWGALKITFFSKAMVRIRTAGFAMLASVALTLYFFGLFTSLGMSFIKSQWTGYFWNSLFLFIFVGFGLSFADVIIIRKEIEEEKALNRRLEPEDDDDQ